MSVLINETIRRKLKVASILDEFSYEWFKYECHLVSLPTKHWEEILVNEKPDLLLVQSAWKGNNGQWIDKIINLHLKKDNLLIDIVNWCKNHNIPTVFWNKEDPYYFKHFIHAAKLFDYIFTTDKNSISRYMKIVGHNRVYTLPFGAQPKIHNPINKDKEKLGKVAFAGTWYYRGHEDRKKDMQRILKPALKYDLHIYDRMHGANNYNYRFPYIYQPFIKGNLSYGEMNNTYKKYDIFLNVNTIQKSPTMFAGRVFELLACGTNVISGYSLGIEKMLPGLIKLCKTKDDTIKYLELLLNNKELRDRSALLGLREVLSKHTYGHRLERILDQIEVRYKKLDKPGVSIIIGTNKQNLMDNIFENYERQNYQKKELIIILNENSMNIEEWRERAKKYQNVRVYKVDEQKTLGECLNFAVDKTRLDYVSKMDDDHYYAPEYLGDLINAYKYTDAHIVGKSTYYIYFEDSKSLGIKFLNKENSYEDFVAGSTITAKKEVFEKVRFATDREVDLHRQFFKDCILNGFRIYSTDRFNHAVCRQSLVEDDFEECEIIGCTHDYRTHVTV